MSLREIACDVNVRASAQRVSVHEGRTLLADVLMALDASPAVRAGSELAEQLMRDVQQCLDGLVLDLCASSDGLSSSSGQHTLSMLSGSHSMQRSVSGSLQRTSSYRTASQSDAILRASLSMQLDGSGVGISGGGGASSASVTNAVRQRMSSQSGSRSDLRGSVSLPSSEHSDGTRIAGKYLLTETTCLGGGGTASVYPGMDLSTNTPVAIKRMCRSRIDCHEGLVKLLKRELNISLRLEHPNIIRLLDVDINSTYVHLVQELATGGDLFELVRSAGPLPERRACGIFRQVVAAVQYCHSMSVYHRDLKLENVVLVRRGDDEVKITDFGMAKDTIESQEGPKTMKVGTISFMPPEVMECSRQDYEGAPVDVWGLGCMLFVMTTSRYPFGFDGRRSEGGVSMHTVMHQIKRGGDSIEFRDDDPPLSAVLVAVVRGMLVADPDQRLTMEQILCSDWVQSDDGYTVPAVAAERAELRSVEWPERPRVQRPGSRRYSVDFPVDGFDDALDLCGDDLGGGLSLETFDTGGILDLGGGRAAQSLSDGVSLDPGGGLSLDQEFQLPDALSPVTEATTSREQTESGGGSSRRSRAQHGSPRPRAQTAASRSRCSLIVDVRESAETDGERSSSPARLAALTPRIGTKRQHAAGSAGCPEETAAQTRRLKEEQEKSDHKLAVQYQADADAEQAEAQQAPPVVVPDGLECPITNELMIDPVICTDGHSYERQAILDWFAEQRRNLQPLTSPLTNVELAGDTLIPNFALKKQCELFTKEKATTTAAAPVIDAAGGA